jgi:hypothetical protein
MRNLLVSHSVVVAMHCLQISRRRNELRHREQWQSNSNSEPDDMTHSSDSQVWSACRQEHTNMKRMGARKLWM